MQALRRVDRSLGGRKWGQVECMRRKKGQVKSSNQRQLEERAGSTRESMKIRKIFRREETQSAQRGPGKSVTTEPRKTLQYLGPLESFGCVTVVCFEATRVSNKPDRS